MKTRITLLLCLTVVLISQAQLRITELMYDPPESGTDSLEYLELYNSSEVDIDLTGYIIEDNAAQDTIAAGTIPAGGYVLTAINPGAILAVLGVTAIETPNVAYRNTGELVMVKDPSGVIIDMVDYSDQSPWPTFADGTDGGGASIELCNLEASGNNGGNWRAAENGLGVMLNDREIKGTPGAANTTTCEMASDITANPNNTFTPADITINVGETLTWANAGGNHNVNGSQDVYPNNPVSFSSGAPSSQSWVFEFTFDEAGVYEYRCDPHAGFGMVGTVTVVGEPEPMFPPRSIADIKENDADGRAILLDSLAEVIGIAHGVNLRPNGLQFTIIDDNGDGIGVFSGGDDFGINYEEGMEMKIGGRITQFNGLTQITAEAGEVISTGNTLDLALEVTELNEDTESQLVSLAPVSLVDPSQWTGMGSGFNVDMISNGYMFTARIDADTDIYSNEPPAGAFRLTGIGGQFDSETPFDSGYQIMPRYMTDFSPLGSNDNDVKLDINVFPNPVLNKLNIRTTEKIEKLEIRNISGQLIYATSDTNKVDVSGLSSGMYLLTVTIAGKNQMVKFVK